MKNLVCNFVFVLSVTTSCASKDALNGFCPSECYTGRKSTNGVGLCKSGVPKCDEGFNVVECVGEVVPFPYDSCDGFDNDCDGKTDEDAFSMSAARFDYTAVEGLNDHPCDSLLGACSASTVSCTGGKYVCNLPTSVELPNEVSCDSVDNDCDGVVDENLFSGEFCYTAPADQWWTSMNPPCHPGRVVCYNGVKQCVNEFLPSPEVCDNADNNCNGIIDDIPLEDAAKYDIVFIFDTSGSMCDEIQAVAGASSMYAQQFDQNENFKFAVVILNNPNLPYVVVYEDFGDFSSIRSAILSLNCAGHWLEYSYDAMFQVCDKNLNPLSLNWRFDAKSLFFMFTDEPAQTDVYNPIYYQDVVSTCVDNSVMPVLWTESINQEFIDVANDTDGLWFELQEDATMLFGEMNSVITQLVCGVQ